MVRVRSRGREDAGAVTPATLATAEARERAGGSVGARRHVVTRVRTVRCARFVRTRLWHAGSVDERQVMSTKS